MIRGNKGGFVCAIIVAISDSSINRMTPRAYYANAGSSRARWRTIIGWAGMRAPLWRFGAGRTTMRPRRGGEARCVVCGRLTAPPCRSLTWIGGYPDAGRHARKTGSERTHEGDTVRGGEETTTGSATSCHVCIGSVFHLRVCRRRTRAVGFPAGRYAPGLQEQSGRRPAGRPTIREWEHGIWSQPPSLGRASASVCPVQTVRARRGQQYGRSAETASRVLFQSFSPSRPNLEIVPIASRNSNQINSAQARLPS